jgi:hypothetical protein
LWARFAGTGFWRNDSQRQPIWTVQRLKRCRFLVRGIFAKWERMVCYVLLMVADISRVCLD